MFIRLFAESGISLERLRALVEVGAAGGIARAVGGDPARQSLFSRQLKELEEFFQTGLTERQGKGIRLTRKGRELARISRFFLMSLSNFQKGCLAEEQCYRVASSGTFLEKMILPVLAERQRRGRFVVETESDEGIERRLHDLTLDFGVVGQGVLSRPLQARLVAACRLRLWIGPGKFSGGGTALKEFKARRLPLVWPGKEIRPALASRLWDYEPLITCETFLQAIALLRRGNAGAFLPDFLAADAAAAGCRPVEPEKAPAAARLEYYLAWNPRLLRLNPHAARERDFLMETVAPAAGGSGGRKQPSPR